MHTLAVAEESGDVERLTAWLVRQTGVRLDTLTSPVAIRSLEAGSSIA